MLENLRKRFSGGIDWILILSIAPLLLAGLVTMKSFASSAGDASDYFFWRQIIWIFIGLAVFFALSFSDLRWLRQGLILLFIYFAVIALLLVLLFLGEETKGAASWIYLGTVSFQPSELAKVSLILLLAKYFSRRHIEIANVKHIIISGLYALLPIGLVFLQPDLGSALVLGFLWFFMLMASGISKKHFFILFSLSLFAAAAAWFFVLAPYQKARIYSFLNPYLDPGGAGYHTIQSKIAVGAGGLFGRGVGFGSQSRLDYLPEHQTDFIFAAFAEEWGLIGALFLFAFFVLLIWRIAKIGMGMGDNFGRLYAVGLASLIIFQFFIHVGMNIGLLPITGLPLPFVSYGGSSIITLFASLGILMSLKIHSSFLATKRTGE